MIPKNKPIKDKEIAIKVKKRDGVCIYCLNKSRDLQAHHIISRAQGGSDILENLISLCWKCHRLYHDGHISKEKLIEKVNRYFAFIKYKTRFELAGKSIKSYEI